MKNLLKLIECGQSYWLDNLSRAMIDNGELKKRVSEQGLRGMTSNPSIFNNAISKSNDYDAQLRNLASQESGVEKIYEALAIRDVQDACDLLRPVFDASGGVDGYVSLEVSPHLAYDTAGTMADARRLFAAVNRPNVMIKIPGTVQGLPAIEEMLFEGVNINITLLFAIERYEEVAKTYIRALERRLDAGKPVDHIASVASFFLSRIDVLMDKLLQQMNRDSASPEKAAAAKSLMGKVAVANAKMAYQSFNQIFSGKAWERLANAGARVQRPLWASTSTKNPDYSDVMYVEPLIGKQTVNTMPEVTIEAFADHGVIVPDAIEQGVDEARQILETVEQLGISLAAVTDQLVEEGVQKFIDPFDQLLETISRKIEDLAAEKITR